MFLDKRGDVMMRLKRMRGITLVELIVAVAIIAVLIGFASAGVEMIRGARVTGVTQQLLADIQTARMQAITHDVQGYGIPFHPPPRTLSSCSMIATTAIRTMSILATVPVRRQTSRKKGRNAVRI
jgi:prepilin-type N-terminal cleavage/methylation domain-containing protein